MKRERAYYLFCPYFRVPRVYPWTYIHIENKRGDLVAIGERRYRRLGLHRYYPSRHEERVTDDGRMFVRLVDPSTVCPL